MKPLEPCKLEFVIAGHSHIFTLGASFAYSGPVSLIPIDASISGGYFLMEEWSAGRGAPYWDALVKHSTGRAAVLVFRGNQHYANFLFARTPLFDFVDPLDSSDDLCPGAILVPRRMVKRSPLLIPGGLQELIPRLRAGGCGYVFVTGTPPVREDFGECIDELRKNKMWRELADKAGIDIETCGCTPAPIMKRLWRVTQEWLEDIARDTGASFVPIPKDAFNEYGYLSAKCRGPLSNFTHTNDEYGRLMLRQIVRAVCETSADSLSSHTRSGGQIFPGHSVA